MRPIFFLPYCLLLLPCLADRAAVAGDHADPEVTALVDREIDAALAAAGVRPAPQADDAELMRRLHLDLLGRIPTVDEAIAFLGDRSPDRFDRLVATLIDHPDMARHWGRTIGLWLDGREAVSNEDWQEYLRRSLERNRPWDRMARDMISPRIDDPEQVGAAHFLGRRANDLDAMTVAVSSGLFGVQLQCAKCHDHPYVAAWKQENYYGLASFLKRIKSAQYEKRQYLAESAVGDVTFTTKDNRQLPARLLFLDGTSFEEPPLPKDPAEQYVVLPNDKAQRPSVPRFSRRDLLVEHAVGDHPYFRRAIVNRTWRQLMGRGLVEPVDQMHAGNPASHPRLLEELGVRTAENGFDLKRLIAGILDSRAYRRSSAYPHGPFPSETLYAAAVLRPLSPEQLALGVAHATGALDDVRDRLVRQKKEATDELVWREFRGGGGNELIAKFVSEGTRFESTASQALFMQFDRKVQGFVGPNGSRAKALAAIDDDRELIRRAFLAVLSRPPVEDELSMFLEFLKTRPGNRAQAVSDCLWALLNSSEFRFVH